MQQSNDNESLKPMRFARERKEATLLPAADGWQQVLARLTAASTDAFVVLDDPQRVRWAGGDVSGVLGLSMEELRGCPLLDRVHPEDRQAVALVVAEAQEGGRRRPTVTFHWRAHHGWVQMRAHVASALDDPAIRGLVLTLRRATPSTPPVPGSTWMDRAGFVAALERMAEAPAHGHAVLALSVANLPQLAAGLGHGRAVKLVQYAGRRVRGAVGREDLVAQVGVDTFAVLLKDVQDDDDVHRVAERMRERLRMPFHVDGQELVIGVSVGFATSEQVTGEGVLDAAEAAASCAGHSRPRAFYPPMREGVRRRLQLAAAMPRALQHDEFQIQYQPIVRVADGRLSGFEALVRWMHPDLGRVSPGEFIPLAEQLGWIVPLDRWMLAEASGRVMAWRGEQPFGLNVNISAKHLDDPHLVSSVASALGVSGMAPHRLHLEVTETAVSADPQRSMGVLAELKALGVSLAIDDFGTGYASLASLADMPFDVLKVDMSFVRRLHEPQGRGVVQSIITMAHDLGHRVVAEGVETPEQLGCLRNMGCDFAQGYLFAAPLSAAQAQEWLSPVE